MLQQPADGSYSYVEDYSNNGSAGISIRQKIGITGGELNVGSNINYLNDFSRKRNSFSTTPFSIGYSQQLWRGRKLYRLEKKIEYAKNNIAIKQYCTKISQIQQQALGLFMKALLGRMEQDLARQTAQSNDTLLQLAHIKLNSGDITDYDLKQIELQSINSQYAYENAVKNYSEAQEHLAVFLGISFSDVSIPEFNVPIAIDTHSVLFYVKRNNPFSKQQEIQSLEAERSLFSAKLSNRFNGNVSLNYGVNQYADNFMDAYRNGNIRQSIVIGVQIAEKAYHLSQEQYRILIQKFSLGKVSVYELTAAQSDQNNAMQRYYSAIRDTYNSYFTLRTMALYDFKRNVELEEAFTKGRL
ncbi:TolC family protein, partial [Bacteroides pyogenes]